MNPKKWDKTLSHRKRPSPLPEPRRIPNRKKKQKKPENRTWLITHNGVEFKVISDHHGYEILDAPLAAFYVFLSMPVGPVWWYQYSWDAMRYRWQRLGAYVREV